MKKQFSVFAIALLLLLLMQFAFAEGKREVLWEGDFAYILQEDGTAEIVQYMGSEENLIVPDALDGHLVSTIGYEAFSEDKSLVSIYIPDGVTVIGEYAFEGCANLVSIDIPDSVGVIGDEAFHSCVNLARISVPRSMTEIGYAVFSGCESLTDVDIPDSVLAIGDEVFRECVSLTEVHIPDSVLAIGDKAFQGCISLFSVSIPRSVMFIGDGAFASSRVLVVPRDSYAEQYCADNALTCAYADAEDLQDILESARIGGRNLFTGTRDFADNGQWTRMATGWTVTSETFNGCTVAQKSAPWNCMSQKIAVEAGETYTYSAWVKASSPQTMMWLFYRDGTEGHCTVEGNNEGRDIVIGPTWQRISFTKTVAEGGIAEPGVDVQNGDVTWSICGIKFERGDTATNWSEAPENFGKTNLFTGTRDFADNGQWTRMATGWTVTSETFNGCAVAQKSAAWNCMSQKIAVEAGETYTYSAWVKASSPQTMTWLFYREETEGHCTVEGNNTGMDIVIGPTWQWVSFTKTVAEGGIAEPGVDVQNGDVTWSICGIKFERGDMATNWCEAPED